jgi:hypothetical protein
MKITLRNDFHDTEANLIVRNDMISATQARRAQKALCGLKDCTCGDGLGCRGPQDIDELNRIIIPVGDGSYTIEQN